MWLALASRHSSGNDDHPIDRSQVVNIKDLQKVMGWDELELGDRVQVKDDVMNVYTHGTVVGMYTDGSYDIEYEVKGPVMVEAAGGGGGERGGG